MFSGKTILITGASTGLGRAMALEAARHGAAVGLVARSAEKLDALHQELTRSGARSAIAVADVGIASEIKSAAQALAEKLGPADILVANAGIGMFGRPGSLDLGQADAVLRTNVLGLIHSVEAVVPAMLERRRGQIAGVASLAGYRGLPGSSVYAASKAAAISYLEGLRIDLRGTGITVTTLCPGFVRTPLTDGNTFDMPFLLEADDAARRMLKAIAAQKREFRFPLGLSAVVRAGQWLPNALYDWSIARSIPKDADKKPKESRA